MNCMKILLILSFIICFFIGCSHYGKIDNDTLYLEFPIRISLESKNENWILDSTNYGYPGNFRLIIENIKKIELYNLQLKGDFILELDNDSERGFKKDDYYLFNSLKVTTSKDSIADLFKKIQSQGVLNYIYFCDEQSSIIDMEHFIRYIFFDSEHFYISDIRAIYKRRLY